MSAPLRVSVSRAADRDVDATTEHLARQSPRVALRFSMSVEATYDAIAEEPTLSAEYPVTDARLAGLRRRSVIGFDKQLVFYRIEGDAVRIVRVLHGARDIEAELKRG